MFKSDDIAHMRHHFDLTNYNTVAKRASEIYVAVKTGRMPPESHGGPWPQSKIDTFYNWIVDGTPRGTWFDRSPTVIRRKPKLRVRKDVRDLTPGEEYRLIQAFMGLMDRDAKNINDPQCYFQLAGIHGVPQSYCVHHQPKYNAWHRAYLYVFENALRSVEGCESVTIPYWDFSDGMPALLEREPFSHYTFPQDVADGDGKVLGKKDESTQRFDNDKIGENYRDVMPHLQKAAGQLEWDHFHGGFAFDHTPFDTFIQAHDKGHDSVGPTMGNQEIASFDPIFYFFHANLDRLYWDWQKSVHATDKNSLLSVIESEASRVVFSDPKLGQILPWTQDYKISVVDTIDSAGSLGVDYDAPASEQFLRMLDTSGSRFLGKTCSKTEVDSKFMVRTDSVNVRVKNVNRMKIPGSFKVHLMRDGVKLGSRAFFQPNNAERCPNCVENPLVHFDFELPIDKVKGGKLSFWVEPSNKEKYGDRIPSDVIGRPTVNVRLLLDQE